MSLALRSVCLVAALLIAAPIASAQDRDHREPGARGAKAMKRADKLGLSEAQREQMKSVARDHEGRLGSLRDAARGARKSLKAVIESSPQDADAIRAAARAASAAQEDLAVERGARRAQARGVLTPEQQQQAAQHKAERAEKRGDREARHAERKAERKAEKAGRGEKADKAKKKAKQDKPSKASAGKRRV